MNAWTLLFYTLEVMKWLIIARAISSWFVPAGSDNPLIHLLRRLTDPILRPIQQLLPDLGGIDISPLVAFVLIQFVESLVARAVSPF